MNFYKKAVAGATPETASKPFGAKDKVAYMMGDLGCNMSFALNSYLMLFWTQFMGISLATWAIIILVLKIWDAINDPIIGSLVDAIRPKQGQSKFKPWIFWGSFALIFAGALCFVPVPTAPMWLKIAICILGYLLWDMSYTIVNVPYGSLNAVISANADERASLSTFRSIGSFIANIVLAVAIPKLIYAPDGNIIGSMLIVIGLACGVVGIIAFQILCLGTTERVIVDYKVQQEGEKFNYWRSLKDFVKNRAAMSFTVVSIFQLLTMAFMTNASSLFIQQTFPNFASMSGIVSLLGFVPTFFVIPFVGKLVKKFGKKEASAWPLLIGVAGGLFLMTVPVEQYVGFKGVLLWLVPSMCCGLGISVNSLVGWAMVADCIDYHEIKTGRREEGVVYANYSLGRKMAQGFGASLVAVALLATGYVPTLGANQFIGVNSNIRYLLGLAYLIGFAAQFLILQFGYNLNKKKVAEMTELLGRENTIENSAKQDD